MKKPTAVRAKPMDSGGKLYQRRALKAFPILVRQAIAGETIYYSEIAAELGIPNSRNMNFVLGAVGRSMLDLSTEWGDQVPPIQALVINKSTEMPGEGFDQFAPDPLAFRAAPRAARRRILKVMTAHISNYSRWDDVLSHFGLPPLPPPDLSVLLPADTRRKLGGAGESDAHRDLKERIAADPSLVGLPASGYSAQIEYPFPSADAVDILFRGRRERVAVEVKSRISDSSDLLRGLFQCVKYRALLDAEAAVEQRSPDGRVVLALEGTLSVDLARIARTLGIAVLQGVGATGSARVRG